MFDIIHKKLRYALPLCLTIKMLIKMWVILKESFEMDFKMYQFEIESIKKEVMNFGEQNIQVVFKTIARCLCPHNFLRPTSP